MEKLEFENVATIKGCKKLLDAAPGAGIQRMISNYSNKIRGIRNELARLDPEYMEKEGVKLWKDVLNDLDSCESNLIKLSKKVW